MAQRGSLKEVKRWNYAMESGGVRGAPGAYLNPSGYSDVSINPSQERLKDSRQLNSRKSRHKSFLGAKSVDFNASIKLHENTFTQYGPLFESALGKKYDQTALALNAVGNTSAVTKITSGVPDPIVKIEYTTGLPDYVPVKTYTGTDINHAILSRIGARTVSAVKNAKACAGGCYGQDPTADEIGKTAFIQADQGAEPDDLSWTAQGFVPTVLELDLPVQDRAGFNITLTGVDYDDSGSASTPDIIEQATFDEEFLGWVWDVNIQSISAPAAPAQQPLVAISGLDLAPTWVPNIYAAGRAASSTIKGSPINGWKQGMHFEKDLVITLDVQSTAWLAALQARTKYGIFLTGYSGQPSDTPNARVLCIWLPECILEDVKSADGQNGIVGHQLSFIVRESLDLTSGHQTHCAVAFFNS